MTDSTHSMHAVRDTNPLCTACIFWHPERADKPCTICRQPVPPEKDECAARIEK